MMLSLNDTQDRALPAIQYNKTNNNSAIKGCFFNNTSPKSSPNDFRSKTDKIFSQMENGNRKFCNNNKSNKWKPREFYSGSETRSEYIGTSGARAAKLESDRVLDTTRRAEYTGTSKAEAPKLESDRVLDTTRSMETKLHKWKKPFPLDDTVTDVIVLHFIESPTTTCWVMQQKHANERSQLIKDINHLHQHIDVIDKDAITINEIFCVLFEGIHHRGLVIYRINSQEVLVRLIDNGHSFPIRISAIKPLHQTARDVNAFAFEINFQTSHAVAIDQILQISKISAEADGVINVRLEEEKTFIQDDLELEPLPVNVPMELFCLDYSKIDMGYISACENDAAKIKSINGLSDQISEYCRLKNDQKYYRPRLEELCLAYLDDDQQWYRAQCIQEENSNLFMLVFIDYGNICEVHSHNIRKMVKQFMQPSIMHMCCINGK